MDLSPYLESLRRDLTTAAAPGGEDVTRTAEMLATALDSSARLCLIEALADATAEITTKLDGATVELRMHGRSVDLVVNTPNAETPPAPLQDGGELTRLTLRLPEQLKESVERAAAAEGISVNSWLARAAQLALRPATPPKSTQGRHYTGYAQA